MTFPSPPTVPDETLEETGWTPVSEDKEKTTKDVLGAFEFDVYMYTKKYEREDGDERDGVFFVNKTRTDPSPADVPLGVGEDRIAAVVGSRAADRLKDELVDRGVEELVVEEETTEMEEGNRLELERITGTYGGNSDDEKVEGWVGVVRRDDVFVTAGGFGPVDNTERNSAREPRDILELIRSAR